MARTLDSASITAKRTLGLMAVLFAIAALVAGIIVGRQASGCGVAINDARQIANPAPVTGPLGADVFQRIALRETPMVVSVRAARRRASPTTMSLFDWFHPFRRPPAQDGAIAVGSGSGFIIVSATAPGDTVPVRLSRNGQELTVTVRIDKLGAQTTIPTPTGADPLTACGLSLGPVPPELARRAGVEGSAGALIGSVQPASPASAAGLMSGDIVLEINHSRVSSAADAVQRMRAVDVGAPAFLLVRRDSHDGFVVVEKR